MDPLFPLTNLWKDFGLFQARCSSVLVSLLPNGTEAKKNSPRQWFRRNRNIILVALFHPEECPVVLYRTSHTGSQAGKGTDRLLLKHLETEKQPIRKTARHIGSKPRYLHPTKKTSATVQPQHYTHRTPGTRLPFDPLRRNGTRLQEPN